MIGHSMNRCRGSGISTLIIPSFRTTTQKMRVCMLLLGVFLSVSVAAVTSEKRFLLDPIFSLLNLDTIKQDLQIMVNAIGSDPTEQLCEQECHKLAQESIIDHGCPLLCQSFQKLVLMFQITPDSS